MRLLAPAAPALMLLLVYAGDSLRQPLWTTPLYFGLLALALGGRVERASGPGWVRAAALVAGGLLALLLAGRPYQGMVIYSAWQGPTLMAAAAAIAAVAIVLLRAPREPVALALLAAGSLALRACAPLQWELEPRVRDMLPLVASAIDRLLAGGNPYGFHSMQAGSEVPLTYPPGLWLAYLPGRALGFDLRWTSWLADVALVGGLGAAAWRRAPARFGPVLLGLATYLFLPDVHWNGIYAEPHVDWALQALFCAAVLGGRPLAAAALCGLALAVRPFDWLWLPFLALWLWRAFGPRVALRGLLLAGALAGALYLPFVLADPDRFFVGTVRWLLDYGPAHRRWFLGMLGFTGPLLAHGLDAWLAPLQLAGLLLATLLAWRRLRSGRHLLGFCAAALAWFTAFNPLIWMSFWIGPALFAMAAGAAPAEPLAVRAPPVRDGPALRLAEGLAAGSVAAALGVCVGLLAGHLSEGGRADVRGYLAERLAPGDRLLDRSGWRVAFLRMPFVFAPAELPRRVELLSDPFTRVAPRPGPADPSRPARTWVVERYGLFAPWAAAYLGPYSVVERRDLGRHRVWQLAPRFTGRAASFSPRAAGDPRRLRRARCRHREVVRGMLRVDAPATLRAPVPVAARWLLLFAGWPDGTPRWGRAGAEIRVAGAGDAALGRLRVPNAAGLRARAFALPAGVDAASLAVRGPEEGALCLDAHFLAAEPPMGDLGGQLGYGDSGAVAYSSAR